MFKRRKPLLFMLVMFAAGGCEWLYVTELKTSGTWTGTVSTLGLVREGENNEVEEVTVLHVAAGPEWSDPGRRNKVNVIGRDMILINSRSEAFSPNTWPHGATLEVRGTMRTVAVFDQRRRRLYADLRRKYLLPTILVEAAKQTDCPAVSVPTILATDAATQPAIAPAIKLTAKAVSSERMDLWWTPIKGAVAYRVEVSFDGKDFNQSAEMDASEPRCSNEGFEPGERCFFRVTAILRTGAEQVSNVADATTPPEAPSTRPIRKPATQSDG